MLSLRGAAVPDHCLPLRRLRLDVWPLSGLQGCHQRLHKRFDSPERWRVFVSTVGDGSKWFEKLSTGLPESLKPIQLIDGVTQNPITISHPIAGARDIAQQMHAIRTAFVRVMGIKRKDMNPNPVGGYKLGPDPRKREQYLDEARRLRNEYAEMVKQHGRGKIVLEKIDSNFGASECSGGIVEMENVFK